MALFRPVIDRGALEDIRRRLGLIGEAGFGFSGIAPGTAVAPVPAIEPGTNPNPQPELAPVVTEPQSVTVETPEPVISNVLPNVNAIANQVGKTFGGVPVGLVYMFGGLIALQVLRR